MSKYGNRKVTFDGFTFDSEAECARYKELKLLLAAEEIKYLAVHPKWNLHAGPMGSPRVQICTYSADFCYFDVRTNKQVVEDVKGVRTQIYLLKKKWLKAEYGIDIVEIAASDYHRRKR